MDRVIAAQRDIARRGGSPYHYTIFVGTDYYAELLPYLANTSLSVERDPKMGGADISLRHEVRA